ncbi:hypothetical protein MNEG_3053 [Monoraphidium neglectum]|uniref:Uncharacterized protein n=1 Tax=Monoraphidium neglectum TaxID=145388 RepID=A0A0D2MQF9_9CHLO|nr:hypothetical protein MNEG_3053 [Monoraphidium neglectum]KIZ04910.1 hypothetical protein MNEG_3053 [Monoraphidium neglectum]|eukprot:XP_013903929.1 hypothetical protein MNEG_3053 [Monoraphidium neglectum]
MTPIQSLLALVNLATLGNALKRITTPKAAIKIIADAPSATTAPLAPLACAPEPKSSDATTPDPVPHAAAADAPTAAKASWFVRAVSGLKDRWRAVTAAAATKTPAAAEKHAPTPRTASATSASATSSTSNTSQAAAAAAPGDDASAPKAPKKANWFARAFATAEANDRRPTTPAAPIKARSGGTPAKPGDAEPATAATVAAPKGRIGAALAAKLARLSSRRSRDRPDQVAAAAEALGGEAAVAC